MSLLLAQITSKNMDEDDGKYLTVITHNEKEVKGKVAEKEEPQKHNADTNSNIVGRKTVEPLGDPHFTSTDSHLKWSGNIKRYEK